MMLSLQLCCFCLLISNNDTSGIMSPAGTSFDPGDFVVSLVTVSLQVSLESIKEFCCVIAVSGRGVSEQEDRRKAVFSAAEHPHE